ncbi:LysM peptidoglycan-binding domain-containing protein [Paenibacillus glufosinatiresistens]|uniref:LysM peptidoglycan-binding domain-containing protein n=1 Tax=Paenibacillus glufosinatiresistens TaxID=3070657 RepID=UPI00286E54CC|nr:LysM peptidoglycan-binding domain-containing protein [Paenibacillus sp. YX.27]
MFDQSNGLRFDIYERVQLPQDLPGIAELEEVELVPDIRVVPKGSQAELYGRLVLTGLYRSEDDRTQRLEHFIPVEITVPLTRVGSIEEVGVEIDNFDIDLLSMRTVNLTGVLSLRGVGEPAGMPAWQKEEYTVAYAPSGSASDQRAEPASPAEEESLYENSLWTYGEGLSEESEPERDSEEPQAYEPETGFYPGLQNEPELTVAALGLDKKDESVTFREKCESEPVEAAPEEGWAALSQAAPREAAAPAATLADGEEAAGVREPEAEEPAAAEWADAASSAPWATPLEAAAPLDPEAAEDAAAFPPEEKPDLKVALGSKKEASGDGGAAVTFSSLLSSSRNLGERTGNPDPEEKEEQGAAAGAASGEPEWKSRFIRSLEGTEPFRRVRLCIVQREETLDSIAEKYRISARELTLYNRLASGAVEEGQILYIP